VIAIFHSIFRFRIFLGINRPIALPMWSITKLFVASRPIPKGSIPPFLLGVVDTKKQTLCRSRYRPPLLPTQTTHFSFVLDKPSSVRFPANAPICRCQLFTRSPAVEF